MAPNSIISLSQRSSMTCNGGQYKRLLKWCDGGTDGVPAGVLLRFGVRWQVRLCWWWNSNTYQTAQQIVIGAPAQAQIANMLDEYLLGHFRGAVQDDVLVIVAANLLESVQELDGHADVGDALDQLHLEGLVAGLQALVDLLQAQQTCGIVSVILLINCPLGKFTHPPLPSDSLTHGHRQWPYGLEGAHKLQPSTVLRVVSHWKGIIPIALGSLPLPPPILAPNPLSTRRAFATLPPKPYTETHTYTESTL